MNILVTGGAGYIGSHTCVELLNSGYDVTVIDNLCNANPKSLNRVEAITGRKVKFYEGDVRNEALLRKIFAENEISAVIHFAGLKAVGESVAQPWRYYDNNLNTTLVLTKVMTDVGCKKIIFSSSATVYSGDNEMPLRETSRTGSCTNPYGWTKYMTEQILSGIAHADKEWSVVLLRYFNPIGAHESGMIGEDPRGIPNNLMPYITQVAIGRREKLSVYGNDYPTPDGTGVRDYIHVVDLGQGTRGGGEIRRFRSWAARCSIWAPESATACWTWFTPLRRPMVSRSRTRSSAAVPATCPPATQTRPRASASLAGRRKRIWKTCAGTPGTGSQRIPWGTGNKEQQKNTSAVHLDGRCAFIVSDFPFLIKPDGQQP